MTEEEGLNSTQMTRLARLTEAGRRMCNTVNRVMDIARVDDRVELLDFEPCDVGPLISSCLGMVEAEARRKGLRLINTIDPATPAQVALARDLVQQVLVNLLMNAVKFTDQGSVELRVVGVPRSCGSRSSTPDKESRRPSGAGCLANTMAPEFRITAPAASAWAFR